MKLYYEPNAEQLKAFALEEGEKLYYCVPTDLEYNNTEKKADEAYAQGSCIAVSDRRFFVLENNKPVYVKELTGLALTRCEGISDPGIKMNDGSRIGPIRSDARLYFAMQSPEKVLGRYANGAVAFGSCRTGRATTVFSGTYQLETPVLRMLAGEAGVHFYSDTCDPVEANERFVSLHVRTAGRKTIKLPRKTRVVEIFSGKRMADGADSFSFDAPLHSSWLFYFSDDAFDVAGK